MLTRFQAQGRSNQDPPKRPSLIKSKLKPAADSVRQYSRVLKSNLPSAKPSSPATSGNKVHASTKTSGSGSATPLQTRNQSIMEIENLKKLNSELLKRLKSVEEDLRNSKLRYEELLTEAHPTITQSCKLPVPVLASSPPTQEPPPPLNLDPTPVSDSHKPRLLVCGDSMIRDFGNILLQMLPQYSIECITYPGASFSYILKDLPQHARHYNKLDIVFVLAGTNEIPHLTPELLEKEFETLRSLAISTNLVFSSVPYRYDNKINLNSNIFATNLNIQSRSRAYGFYYFEANYFLSRNLFTRHGLHFNITGKNVFCKFLANSLFPLNIADNNYSMILPHNNNSITNLDYHQIEDISCPFLDVSLIDVINNESTENVIHEIIDNRTLSSSNSHNSTFFLDQLPSP